MPLPKEAWFFPCHKSVPTGVPLHSSLPTKGVFSAHHWRVRKSDPALMAPSKAQSSQGIARLEWGTQLLVPAAEKAWQGV